MKSLMGYQLPLQGEGLGGPIFIDWKASAFLLLAGMPGSGKTVSLTSILAQQLGMQTFNDEQSVPVVPEHVKASVNHARSVGLCDLDGKAPSEAPQPP